MMRPQIEEIMRPLMLDYECLGCHAVCTVERAFGKKGHMMFAVSRCCGAQVQVVETK